MCKRIFIPLAILLVFVAVSRCLADVLAQFEQAQTYEEQRQYGQAEQIYQQIVTDHPGTDDALKAQKNLAILYVGWDRQPEAETALLELLGNFSQHEAIATVVTHVADTYRKFAKHASAGELYKYVIANWPQDEHAMWSQMGLAISNTCLADEQGAEAAFDKLCSEYSGHEPLGRAICLVADNYRRLERNEKASELYRRGLVPKNWYSLYERIPSC